MVDKPSIKPSKNLKDNGENRRLITYLFGWKQFRCEVVCCFVKESV